MTSLPVVEPHSKTGARLRIKYNRTTIVLNILLTPILLKSYALFSSGCVFFWGGHPVNCVFLLVLKNVFLYAKLWKTTVW